MNLELTDRVALVTGASAGIGAAVAQVLAAEGADVVIGYGQNRKGALYSQQQVESFGRRAWLAQMDLAQPDSIATAVEQLQSIPLRLDILIYCAGYNRVTPLQDISPAEWDHVLGVNLNGAFYLVQSALALMRPGGTIVTVASVAAHTGAPHHMHYAAAKAGLVNLTKSLARALAPEIRVNCVAPGLALTEMGQAAIAALAPDYAETRLLVKRFATPEEIARCIVFVASPVAGFMTGATIDINGGREMR